MYALDLLLAIGPTLTVLVVAYVKSLEKNRAGNSSKYGVSLPAPKLGLPSHLKDHETLIAWMQHHPSIYNNDVAKRVLIDYCRHWRIERARADDLERMVDLLQEENRKLRKPSLGERIRSMFRFSVTNTVNLP